MKKAPAVLAITAALIALGVVGCGGDDSTSSSPSSPEDVALAYWEASEDADGAGMCAVMSADLHGPGDDESCAKTAAVLAKQRTLPDPEVTNSKTKGDTATVDITGSNDLAYITYLVNEDGEWRVDNAEPK